jgi:hypothetical protein
MSHEQGPMDKSKAGEQKIDKVIQQKGEGHQEAGHNLRSESFGAMEKQGTKAFADKADKTGAKDAKSDSPINLANHLAQALTGVDFRTADQKELSKVINQDMAKAFTTVAESRNKEAIVKLQDVYKGAIDGTQERIKSVTQRHAGIVASLPAAEKLAYEEQVKRLSRGNMV